MYVLKNVLDINLYAEQKEKFSSTELSIILIFVLSRTCNNAYYWELMNSLVATINLDLSIRIQSINRNGK